MKYLYAMVSGCLLAIATLSAHANSEYCTPTDFSDKQDVIENYVNECSSHESAVKDATDKIDMPFGWTTIPDLAPFWEKKSIEFREVAATKTGSIKAFALNLAQRAEVAAHDARHFPTCEVPRYGKGTWSLNSDTQLRRGKTDLTCAAYPSKHVSIDLAELIDACDGAQCQAWTEIKPLLDKYVVAKRIAHLISLHVSNEVHKSVKKKLADWDAFAETGKAMLPWDMKATEWGWGGVNFKPEDGFVAAPDVQWFLFHPGLGYEINDNEPDGERTSPALYLEVGVNWWREQDGIDLHLARLTGGSLIAVASDRINTDDIGWGVMLTFDNAYELSINKYGGEHAVMVGYNLYNLWEEQYKKEVAQWRKTLKKIAE